MAYKLSAALTAHSSDVKAVVSPADAIVLSGSRDTTAIAWHRPSPEAEFTTASIYHANTRYVNSVTYIPPTPDAKTGYLVAGGQDSVINVYSLASASTEPAHVLLGHRENVCALDASPSGTIVSGSWDKTARVWKNFQLAFELTGHSQAVWAVLAIDDDQYLTASADKTIKLWHSHKNVHTYTGHTDAVRGLASVPDIGFASCSNDSEIRVWTTGGDLVYTLSGHTSFVYSLAVLPTGEIVSGGEDRSVRVWRDGECVQSIIHPAISVWTVSVMPNGDIVSGCSDGVVRIFTKAEERFAKPEDIAAYDERVASQALAAQEADAAKRSDLPGLEALSQPGKKEGQVIMVQNNNMTEAHQWSSASNRWEKIGEVVDSVGSNRKQLYNGKEYDYVFDVDIKDGAPPLKLPYNTSENAFDAAQRFMAANDLPLAYLDQIVDFIDKNTGGSSRNVPIAGSEEFVDPWTGASRHRPTGATRPPPVTDTRSYVDPYTGASRYVPGGGAAATPQTPKILPVRTPLSFKQVNVTAMRTKFLQLNDTLAANTATPGVALSEEEKTTLEHIFTSLTTAVASENATPKGITYANLAVVFQILARWPETERFPVLDLIRLLAAFFPSAFTDPLAMSTFVSATLKAADWDSPWTTPLPKPRETNVVLALRTFANALHHGGRNGSGWVLGMLAEVAKAPYSALGKTQRVALATISLNVSCLALGSGVDARLRETLFSLTTKILKGEDSDGETVYRALVALGNLLSSSSLTPPERTSFREAKTIAGSAGSKFSESRIKNLATEVASLVG